MFCCCGFSTLPTNDSGCEELFREAVVQQPTAERSATAIGLPQNCEFDAPVADALCKTDHSNSVAITSSQITAANGLDVEARIRFIRDLLAHEAHLRAAAAIVALQEELQKGPVVEASDRFDSFCSNDPEVQRLRIKERKLLDAMAYLKVCQEEQCRWDMTSTLGSGQSVATLKCRTESQKHIFWVSSGFDSPFFQVLSLFQEVELYPNWLPFVWEAKTLHRWEGRGQSGSYAQRLVLIKIALPWPMQNREAVIFAFGCDMLERNNVVLLGGSVPADATEWWGVAIPPAGSATRIDLDLQVFLSPQGAAAQGTHMNFVVKMDLKIDWLPKSFLSRAGTQFVKLLVGNINSIVENYDKSPYSKLVQRDVNGIYAVLKGLIVASTKGELREGGPLPHSHLHL